MSAASLAAMSAADAADQQLVNNFEVPSWAGKPPTGLHLDVLKEGKLIQKLMLDEKKCYYFGRNRQLCDFPIDHASASRVHGALVWHKFLERPFLIDLGSAHGTFIGEHIRLEPNNPQQIPQGTFFHFGASTRMYLIRERPNAGGVGSEAGLKSAFGMTTNAPVSGSTAALPEDENELDNLTEYNTAHNRRIASLIITDQRIQPTALLAAKKAKKKFHGVVFGEEPTVINPEDVDPSVGRFRNLCQTVVIPTKRSKTATPATTSPTAETKQLMSNTDIGHSVTLPAVPSALSVLQNPLYSAAAKLNIPLPNLAPNLAPSVSLSDVEEPPPYSAAVSTASFEDTAGEIRRKKYAKEAWPGKKPSAGGNAMFA